MASTFGCCLGISKTSSLNQPSWRRSKTHTEAAKIATTVAAKAVPRSSPSATKASIGIGAIATSIDCLVEKASTKQAPAAARHAAPFRWRSRYGAPSQSRRASESTRARSRKAHVWR
jgi:hypothetical protein